MASLKYTHAVVCRLPNSFKSVGDVNLDEAKAQHEAYVRLLRGIGLDVIELPPDEAFPLSSYVDDTAVVCNGVALITRPGNPDRLKEVDGIRAVLKKELDLPIVEITDENAKLDGSDVLFTGREFFVGLSDWTNEAGAKAVAAAFPEYACTPIKVGENQHLKAIVTMAGPDVFCVASTNNSQQVIKRIEREASFSYQTITVPEDLAANVLYANGSLLHRTSEEIPLSARVFAERIDYPRRTINLSQLSKSGACSGLTSCCLLIRRMRHIRNL